MRASQLSKSWKRQSAPAVVSLWTLLLGVGLAHGQTAELDLRWDAPARCPDRSWVLRAVRQSLASSSAQPTATVRAQGRVIARDTDHYELELRTRHGERQLRSASCEELARSAALIVALLIDPRAVATPPAGLTEPEPHNLPQSTAPPRTTRTRPPSRSGSRPPAPARPAARPLLGGYGRAELLADAGTMPQMAAGVGLALGLRWSDSSLELSGGFLPNRALTNPARKGPELARLQALVLRLGLCQQLVSRPLELTACGLVEHLRLHAAPSGALREPAPQTAPVWSLLGAARVALRLGTQLAWVIELSAGVPVRGARFSVTGLGTVHETGPVVGRLRTGPELRF